MRRISLSLSCWADLWRGCREAQRASAGAELRRALGKCVQGPYFIYGVGRAILFGGCERKKRRSNGADNATNSTGGNSDHKS